MKILNFKFQIPNKYEGFTLIELLLYMGIFTILLGVLFTVFNMTIDSRNESDSFSPVQQDGNYILSRMSYDITRASKATIPASLGASVNSLQLLINGTTYTYALDNSGNLQLTNSQGINNLNSYGANVSNFTVTKYGNGGGIEDALKISLTLTGRTQRKSSSETKTIQTTISLRRN